MQKIDLNIKTILVTGHAGFIGSNLVNRLFHDMKSGTIVGVDNLNSYYDPTLKIYRLVELDKAKPAGINFVSVRGDIADKAMIDKLFAENKFDIVVNLAAQAGVRYSIENPDAYIQSNMIGFYNILEACRASQKFQDSGSKFQEYQGVQHLVYASSSSPNMTSTIESIRGRWKGPLKVEPLVEGSVGLPSRRR